MSKKYADAIFYENKLKKVMGKLGIKEFNYNWDRFSSYVEFRYKGQLYRFDHSIDNAKAHGIALSYGTDVFAQLVLALEDLARMMKYGIYDLQIWISGMKFLPHAVEIPSFFKVLGFEEIPGSAEEVKTRFRNLAKQLHPDTGGNEDDFIKLQKTSEDAIKYMSEVKGG